MGAADLHDEYHEILNRNLKCKYEGRCSRFGYIKRESIVVLKVSPGTIRQSSLNGDVLFLVQFRASVFNPLVGTKVEAVVCNENRFGVLACVYADGQSSNATSILDSSNVMMNIVISKNSTIQSNQAALSKLSPGTRVTVEILGKRFVPNDTSISAIGRIVSAEDGDGEMEGGGGAADTDDGIFKLAEEGNDNDSDDQDAGTNTEADEEDDEAELVSVVSSEEENVDSDVVGEEDGNEEEDEDGGVFREVEDDVDDELMDEDVDVDAFDGDESD